MPSQRRRAMSAVYVRHNTSIFGSPEPQTLDHSTSSDITSFDKPVGASFSYKTSNRYLLPLDMDTGRLLDEKGRPCDQKERPHGNYGSPQGDETYSETDNMSTPTTVSSLRNLKYDNLDVDDIKLKRYQERHLIGKNREPRIRLPKYETALMETYKRSYNRQVVATKSAPSYTTTINTWTIFPSVEDIQASQLVEKQYHEAMNPHTEYPSVGDWMDLYIGEDGVYTFNTALSQMPVTGKRTNDCYKRGIKMLLMFRPLVVEGKKNRPFAELGFKFTVMDNGIYVSHVLQDSAASRAGLRYGDQILRINKTYCSGSLPC